MHEKRDSMVSVKIRISKGSDLDPDTTVTIPLGVLHVGVFLLASKRSVVVGHGGLPQEQIAKLLWQKTEFLVYPIEWHGKLRNLTLKGKFSSPTSVPPNLPVSLRKPNADLDKTIFEIWWQIFLQSQYPLPFFFMRTFKKIWNQTTGLSDGLKSWSLLPYAILIRPIFPYLSYRNINIFFLTSYHFNI